MFAALALLAAAVFAVAVPYFLHQFISRNITSVAGLKTTLGIVEAATGLYTGALIDAPFGGVKRDPQASQPQPPSVPALASRGSRLE